MACRILTPAKGDSHDHRDTPCGLHVHRLLCLRRQRGGRASHRLCPTHVDADGPTVAGARHLWAWRDATTTLAPLAAQATPWDEQVAVSPEAIPPRLHRRARALRQDRLQRARATGQGGAHVCEDGLCTDCTKVSLAERTGGALPERRHALLPGSGGSAATAGATIQAVWDSKSRVGGPCALTPWHRPAQT